MTPPASFLDRNLYFLVHLKGLLKGGFGRKYYSQWGEDVILSSIFSNKQKGFYVDVGAYHPLHYSNTYLLHKKGWNGINIDPNPNAIKLFNRHRPKDINIVSGICEKPSVRPYYIFNHQSCNTFSPEQKELMLKKSFIRFVREIDVQCVPLQKILDDYTPGKSVDILNVDVEGMSLEVLRSLNWNKTKPKVICVEDDDFNFTEGGSEVHTFLVGHSYALHSKVGQGFIYALRP